jgi:hypothetical protein
MNKQAYVQNLRLKPFNVQTFLHFGFWDKKGERFVRTFQQVASDVEHLTSYL